MIERVLRAGRENALLLAVLAAAVLVRLWGLTHDLPFNYYPDEAHFVKRTLAFGSGDLNPHWFHKPALYMYLLFIEYGVYYVVGSLFGWFASVDDFARHYFTDPSMFYLLGRLTTTAFGVATVYLIYLVGVRYGGKRVGLISALFLAVMFAHVRGSHFVKADVPAAFFSVAAFLFVLKVLENGRTRDYIGSGALAGLGTATKYYSVTLLPVLYLAHVLVRWRERAALWKRFVDWKIVLAGVIWCLAFFVGAPYNFLDFETFKETMITPPPMPGSERAVTGVEPGMLDTLAKTVRGMGHAVTVMLRPTAFGAVLGITAFAGVALMLLRRRARDLVLLAAVGIYFLVACEHHHVHLKTRHLIPIYPFLCVAAAIAVERLSELRWLRSRAWAPGLACLLIVLSPVYEVVQFDRKLSRKETRTLAKEWIEANIPRGTKILLDVKGPRLSNSRENLEKLYERATQKSGAGGFTTHLEPYFRYQLEAVGAHTYDLTQIHHAWWNRKEPTTGVATAETEFDIDFGNPVYERGVMPLEYYRENGYEYVVTTSGDYNKFLYGYRKDTFPSVRKFYEQLFAQATPIMEIAPEDELRRGPVVKIFRLDPLNAGQRSE